MERMTVKQAAEYLKVSQDTVYELARARKIRHYRIGRAIRFDVKDLDVYFAGCALGLGSLCQR